MNWFFYFLLIIFITFSNPARVLAVTTPDFGTCVSPSGSLKVSYDNGVHGIPGSTTEYKGKDAVYTQDGRYLQCYCADHGDGIQTNWLKATSYSEDDIKILKSQGWIYVPDGSAWGLTGDPYLAYNLVYYCRGDKGGVGGTSQGLVLGVSTASIAPTGQGLYMYAMLGLGAFLVILGLATRLFRKTS